MATVTRCYTPIKGRVMRVVALDECGVPLCDDDPGTAAIIASGFTQVAQSAQYDTGEEHIVRDADSNLCVNEKDPDALKRLELTIDLCTIDVGLIPQVLIGSRLLTRDSVGEGFALAEGIDRKHWSLEVWQRVTGDQACDASGAQQWVYNAWPHLNNGKVGDYNVAAAPSTLQLIAESKAVNELWWLGDDWLGDAAVSVIKDHWFQSLTTVDPPEADCGIQDLACAS